MADRPEIIFHAGVEKTGSTLIQNTLRRNADGLARRGVTFIDKEAFAESLLGRSYGAIKTDGLVWSPQALDRIRKDWRDRGWEAGGKLLVSHEFLLGSAQGRFYINAPHLARRLVDAFPDRQVRFILYVKRQDRLYESIYKQRISSGRVVDPDTFHERVQPERMDWTRLLLNLGKAVGGGNVRVAPGEIIRDGGEGFVRHFLGLADIPWEGPLEAPRTSNRSYNRKGHAIAERCNELLDKAEQAALRKFLAENFPAGKDDPGHVLPALVRYRIARMHAEANRYLFSRWLKRYKGHNYAALKPLKKEAAMERLAMERRKGANKFES